jgi:hypothetical protein
MTISNRLRGALWLGAPVILCGGLALAKSGGKEILMDLSWGDQIAFAGTSGGWGETPLLAAETFRKTFREYKEAGVDVVLFRLDVFRWVRDYDWPDPRTVYRNVPPKVLEAIVKQWVGAHEAVKANLLKLIVGIAHEEGLKIFAYHSTFDEGMPFNEIMVEKGTATGMIDAELKPWISETDITGDAARSLWRLIPNTSWWTVPKRNITGGRSSSLIPKPVITPWDTIAGSWKTIPLMAFTLLSATNTLIRSLAMSSASPRRLWRNTRSATV